jgi:hypothetical protein
VGNEEANKKTDEPMKFQWDVVSGSSKSIVECRKEKQRNEAESVTRI